MPRKRALILLNLSAGIGKAGTFTMDVIRKTVENGYEPVVYPIIPGKGLTAEKIIPDYEENTDLILCSGGDGTLNHVIRALMKMKVMPLLGYIPAGSTNDFAKGLGIPVDFEKALSMIFNGTQFRYDVGSLNGQYFNYIAAFGAFSKISYATDQQLKNILGHAAYILNAMLEFNEHIRYSCHIRVETDDGNEEGDYLFGAVCNTFSIGGFTLFKGTNVRLNDGKMELLLIRTPKNPAELQEILNAFLTGTMDHPCITFKQVSGLRMTFDTEIPWTLDGEFGGAHKEVSIRVHHQAVNIMRGL